MDKLKFQFQVTAHIHKQWLCTNGDFQSETRSQLVKQSGVAL